MGKFLFFSRWNGNQANADKAKADAKGILDKKELKAEDLSRLDRCFITYSSCTTSWISDFVELYEDSKTADNLLWRVAYDTTKYKKGFLKEISNSASVKHRKEILDKMKLYPLKYLKEEITSNGIAEEDAQTNLKGLLLVCWRKRVSGAERFWYHWVESWEMNLQKMKKDICGYLNLKKIDPKKTDEVKKILEEPGTMLDTITKAAADHYKNKNINSINY